MGIVPIVEWGLYAVVIAAVIDIVAAVAWVVWGCVKLAKRIKG